MYNLIIIALATYEIVEIIHHGEIFSRLRLYLSKQITNNTWLAIPGKIINCPFCLCVWVSLFVCLTFNYLYIIILAFCVAAIANITNDLLKRYELCYTPAPSDQIYKTKEEIESNDGK